MGVVLVLGLVLALIFCLIAAIWELIHCIRSRARKKAVILGIVAAGIIVFDMCAIHAVAPKGARTIAQLEIPGNRCFVVRHYRSGWFEHPEVRFYARDRQGIWTSFAVIWELVNPNSTSLVLDASEQEIQVPGVGSYRIQDNDFVNPDGSRCTTYQLPQGVEPGEEDIH